MMFDNMRERGGGGGGWGELVGPTSYVCFKVLYITRSFECELFQTNKRNHERNYLQYFCSYVKIEEKNIDWLALQMRLT